MIQTGPVILAMNHQSYLDPPLAGITCDRAIYFLARRTLTEVPLLGWLLPKLNVIPVNQEGIDRSALKTLIRVLKSGNAAAVCILCQSRSWLESRFFLRLSSSNRTQKISMGK